MRSSKTVMTLEQCLPETLPETFREIVTKHVRNALQGVTLEDFLRERDRASVHHAWETEVVQTLPKWSPAEIFQMEKDYLGDIFKAAMNSNRGERGDILRAACSYGRFLYQAEVACRWGRDKLRSDPGDPLVHLIQFAIGGSCLGARSCMQLFAPILPSVTDEEYHECVSWLTDFLQDPQDGGVLRYASLFLPRLMQDPFRTRSRIRAWAAAGFPGIIPIVDFDTGEFVVPKNSKFGDTLIFRLKQHFEGPPGLSPDEAALQIEDCFNVFSGLPHMDALKREIDNLLLLTSGPMHKAIQAALVAEGVTDDGMTYSQDHFHKWAAAGFPLQPGTLRLKVFMQRYAGRIPPISQT